MKRRSHRWLWVTGAPVRLALLTMIRAYRMTLGGVLGGQCRFHPSCSQYAELAVRDLGAARGTVLAVWRVLRCSPLSGGGVDYPPVKGPLYDAHIQPAPRPERVGAARGVGA